MKLPEKIYLTQIKNELHYTEEIPSEQECIEYVRNDVFVKKVKEAFCKATCNGHPPRSTCTSLGTCKEYDNFIKKIKYEGL